MKTQQWRDAAVDRQIAARLKKFRIACDLTQEDVRFEIGVNIARVESGRHSPTTGTLARLCDLYEISLEELFRSVKTQHSHGRGSRP